MFVNGENEDDVSRLKISIQKSRDAMHGLLSHRQDALSAYQGPRMSLSTYNAGMGHADPRISVPMMAIAIELYEQLLAGESIRTVVRPRREELTADGHALKEAGDLMTDAIELSATFREWVKEAMWGAGVLKVGRSFSRNRVAGRGGSFTRQVAMPFADVIDTEDLLIDTEADRWSQKKFIGNEYLVPLEWAKEERSFTRSARKELQPAQEPHRRYSASPMPKDYIQDSLMPMTVLMDVYIPWDNRILTLGKTGPRTALRDEPFDGPSIGPYHQLALEQVVGSVMPRPMSWDWIDAHDTINILWNKAVRQYQSAKRNPLVPVGAEKIGDNIRKAADGEWVPTGNLPPGGIPTFVLPGADPGLVAFIGQLIELFSYISGNINLLGGLEAQSGTLGQDKLLSGAGSRRIAELQRRSKLAFGKVIRSLYWYIFRQKNLKAMFLRKIGDQTVELTLAHEDIKGKWLEFAFEIEPIRHKSPDERLGLLLQWIRNVLVPMRVEMAQAGQRIDMKALNEIGRDWGDLPELDLIVKDLGRRPTQEDIAAVGGRRPTQGGGGAGGGGGGQAQPAPRQAAAQPAQAPAGAGV